MAKGFVLLRVDSKNGRSAENARFFLQRNQGYVLFLDSQGRELARLRSNPRRDDTASATAILEGMRSYKSGKQKGLRGARLLERLSKATDIDARQDAQRWLVILKSARKVSDHEVSDHGVSDYWQRDRGLTSRRIAVEKLMLALDHELLRPFAIQTIGVYGRAASIALPRLLDDVRKQKKHIALILDQLPKIDPLGKKSLPVIETARTLTCSKAKAAATRALQQIEQQIEQQQQQKKKKKREKRKI